MIRLCKSCGVIVRGPHYCNWCGSFFLQVKESCHRCSYELGLGEQFCGNCGEKLLVSTLRELVGEFARKEKS